MADGSTDATTPGYKCICATTTSTPPAPANGLFGGEKCDVSFIHKTK